MEGKPLQGLIDLKAKAEEMWTFKGRAALIKKIQSSIDMIGMYKTDTTLEEMLYKERLADYEAGIRIMDEKYKEQPGEATN